MKNKGISLIVLIITIIVIIILATAIIVNIAQSNIIGNANIAVLSGDFQTFNEQLRLYKSEQLIETKGKFKADLLNANYDSILVGENIYKEGNIYDILTNLKDSNYDKKIYIQEGKMVVDSKKFTSAQIYSLKKIGINAIDISLKVKTISTSSYNSITAKLLVTLGEVEKYYFRLGESGEYIESQVNEYTFDGLELNTTYTVYMKVLKADGEESVEYTEDVITKDITGEVTISRNPQLANGEYTNENIKVTLSYGENIPTGYELQYKLGENDWVKYTEIIEISENTTIKARLYNKVDDDEKASNSVTISGIDKNSPVADIIVENITGKTDINVTVIASDNETGISKIMYYYKKTNETEYKLGGTISLKGESDINKSFTITNLESETEYNIYADVYDTAQNKVTTERKKIITPLVYDIAFDNTNGTQNTTINGEDFAYNNPVVPVGFMAVNTGIANWNDENGWDCGLVIVDERGNEFVWVPVDGINVEYKRWCSGSVSYSVTGDHTGVLPVADQNSQISKYSGFYVGRYEAGVPKENGIPVVQKGATVWSGVSYSSCSSSAKLLCNNEYVKSGLLSGSMWDTVAKWIQNSGMSVTDIRAWGNCANPISPANVEGCCLKQPAGFSEYWKAKNIYNYAGNFQEWVAEIYGGKYPVYRGGCYGAKGNGGTTPVYRNYSSTTYAQPHISFRIALYVI